MWGQEGAAAGGAGGRAGGRAVVPSIKVRPGEEAQVVRSPGARAWGSWTRAAVCRLRVTDRGQLASGLEHRGEGGGLAGDGLWPACSQQLWQEDERRPSGAAPDPVEEAVPQGPGEEQQSGEETHEGLGRQEEVSRAGGQSTGPLGGAGAD